MAAGLMTLISEAKWIAATKPTTTGSSTRDEQSDPAKPNGWRWRSAPTCSSWAGGLACQRWVLGVVLRLALRRRAAPRRLATRPARCYLLFYIEYLLNKSNHQPQMASNASEINKKPLQNNAHRSPGFNGQWGISQVR